MQPENKGTPAAATADAPQTASQQFTPKRNRPRLTPSQTDRVKAMLSRGWQCGINFLDPPDGLAPILRYTGRIHELRKDGWLIDRRPCEHPWHDHNQSQMWEWKIVGHANDGTLPGIGDV